MIKNGSGVLLYEIPYSELTTIKRDFMDAGLLITVDWGGIEEYDPFDYYIPYTQILQYYYYPNDQDLDVLEIYLAAG